MKRLIVLLCACVAALFAVSAERKDKGETVTLTMANAEIVVAPTAAKVVRFAAAEAKTFLSDALGVDVPVVVAPTPGKSSLVLGMNEWAADAGLSTNDLVRDAFKIAAKGGCIYVFGRDSATADPEWAVRHGGWSSVLFERATMFGVYDFLEQEVGVKFYFPGELGTIVPKRDSVTVTGVRTVTPDFSSRFMQAWNGEYMEPDKDGYLRTLNYFRLRYETDRIPCCHGTTLMMYPQRFGKSHPEYFALMQDGTRCSSAERVSASVQPGQLCWSSGIVEEMYLDAASYLKGEPATVRGIPSRNEKGKIGWNGNCKDRRYVDLMPQDGWTGCRCAKCRGKAEGDLVWGAITNIAWRLKREGISGNIVNMAYSGCKRIPEMPFPENVSVMVAPVGPWAQNCKDLLAQENALVIGWSKKLGHKVWLWNYANKWGVLVKKARGIPTPAPRAWAAYYKSLAPYIDGAFVQSETDRWFNNQLNYYVYSRVCWDNGADVETILSTYFRDMFGAANVELAEVFRRLEEWWIIEFVGNVVDSPMGPLVRPPKDSEIWGRIYSAERLDGLDELVSAARSKVAAESVEARRIDLVEREFLKPLRAESKAYFVNYEKVKALRFPMSVGGFSKVTLRPFSRDPSRSLKATVRTHVTISRTEKDLVFAFDCEEPKMDDRAAGIHAADDPRLWMDDVIEVVLFPDSLNPDHCYHLFLNSAGCWTDSFDSDSRIGAKWNSGMKTSVSHRRDGWAGTFVVPLAAFPYLKDEVRFEVARERNLQHDANIHHLYNLSPSSNGFRDQDNLAILILK